MCSFKNFQSYTLCVCVFSLHVCMGTTCVPMPEKARRENCIPVLELQTVVRCRVGAGTKTWVYWKSIQFS